MMNLSITQLERLRDRIWPFSQIRELQIENAALAAQVWDFSKSNRELRERLREVIVTGSRQYIEKLDRIAQLENEISRLRAGLPTRSYARISSN